LSNGFEAINRSANNLFSAGIPEDVEKQAIWNFSFDQWQKDVKRIDTKLHNAYHAAKQAKNHFKDFANDFKL
jgi:hypothetical protein